MERTAGLVVCAIVVAGPVGCGSPEGEAEGLPAAVSSLSCDIAGFGVFDTGDVFSGSASNVTTSAVNWAHVAPEGVFSATSGNVTCRRDGDRGATIRGDGIYRERDNPRVQVPVVYDIIVTDNRPAPVSLSAQRGSSGRVDGRASFDPPEEITVPAAVIVTDGTLGRKPAQLRFDDLRCNYRSDGENYVFHKCVICAPVEGDDDDDSEDDDDDDDDDDDRACSRVVAPIGPGDKLTVSSARLRLRSGRPGASGFHEATAVIAAELVPTPDSYDIAVFDASRERLIFFIADVIEGDIAIVIED